MMKRHSRFAAVTMLWTLAQGLVAVGVLVILGEVTGLRQWVTVAMTDGAWWAQVPQPDPLATPCAPAPANLLAIPTATPPAHLHVAAAPMPITATVPAATPPAEPRATATRRPATAQATPAPLLPTRLVINAIELDAPIVPSDVITGEHVRTGTVVRSWTTPAYFAVGWHRDSAPLSAPGNTVLNGHNNLHGSVFRHLGKLARGDTLRIYAGDTSRSYIVTEREVLHEAGAPLETRLENARWLAPSDDERITLVTCWPPTGNSHRLVIVAKPFDTPVP